MLLLSICLTLLLMLIILYLYCTFIPSITTYLKVCKFPGPKGLPIIGSALAINRLQEYEILQFFQSVIHDYPRYALLWILGVPFVIMDDPEDLAEVLGSSTNIEKGVEYLPLRPWLNEGLLLSTGEKWHSRRKLLTPTFHFKILEENLQSMQKHAKNLVSKFLQKAGQEIDLQEIIPLCTLDVMCETAMGVELGALDNPAKEYVSCIKKVGSIAIHRVQNLQLHREWIFGLTPLGKEFNKYLKQLHDFTIKIIREKKAAYKAARTNKSENINGNGYGGNKRKAFLDLLLELDCDNKLSEVDIREEVDTFLFEGHDTTAAAITFSIFLLGIHQDVQAKVVEELESILQGDEPITKQNLNDMKYLECVIKEVLRLYPSVPYISRMITQDIKLKDNLTLPAGVNTVICPFIVHRKPELYEDPEKFDPERFTKENSNARHPFAYIPFSAGPKNCIGQKFAMMEIKVVLASVLKSVHVQTLTKEEDVKCLPALIMRSDIPLLIKTSPRNS